MLIDTHAHLYWDSFKEDFDQVIKRSLNAGVTTIINVGVDVELSKIALRQAQGKLANIPGLTVYSTIGIHPHEAQKYLKEDIQNLEAIYRSNSQKVAAVGECGLDYVEVDSQTKQLQRQLFQAQIDLAKKLNLPLIVHCRQAWDEVLPMIDDYPAILHCYSGLPKTTNHILQTTNLLVSFAATITYPKNDYLREAARILPLEKIILETDCPFLPPQSKRGQRNEPANVREVAQTVADLKAVSLDKIATQTTANVVRLFAFPT